VEIVADDIGPSLRWATAEVRRNERRGSFDSGGGSGGSGGSGGGGGGGGERVSAPAARAETADDMEEPF